MLADDGEAIFFEGNVACYRLPRRIFLTYRSEHLNRYLRCERRHLIHTAPTHPSTRGDRQPAARARYTSFCASVPPP